MKGVEAGHLPGGEKGALGPSDRMGHVSPGCCSLCPGIMSWGLTFSLSLPHVCSLCLSDPKLQTRRSPRMGLVLRSCLHGHSTGHRECQGIPAPTLDPSLPIGDEGASGECCP